MKFNTFEFLCEIHWSTLMCKSQEISSVLKILWTDEFNLYKNADPVLSYTI